MTETGEFPDEAYPAATTVQKTGQPVEVHFEEPDDDRWREDFTGLLFLGALRGWIDWCGHRIAMRTLNTDEELLIAQLVKDLEGGMGGMKGYATATAGLCVEAIDHQAMPVPLGEHPNQQYKWALERFNYARRWFPPTIDTIFDAYLTLEKRQREILVSLGKSSAQGESATPGLSASSGSPTGGGF